MRSRILLVEDEHNIRKLVKLNLEMEGFEVDVPKDGLEAIRKIDSAHYDIIVLDLMLPELNGISVLKKIKLTHSDIPVIITSARDTSADRILGLKTGADDYLNKPFSIEELIIRIRKLIKRGENGNISTLHHLSFGKNKVNFQEYSATNEHGPLKLTKKEILLLKYLAEHANEVIPREDLLKNIWGYDVYPSTRTIDNFILSLRKHFEIDPKNPKHFFSVRGVGYKFVP